MRDDCHDLYNTIFSSGAFPYIGSTSSHLSNRISNRYYKGRNINKCNNTGLSKLIWFLKEHNKQFHLKWKILSSSFPYDKGKSLTPLFGKAHF